MKIPLWIYKKETIVVSSLDGTSIPILDSITWFSWITIIDNPKG